MKTTPIIPNYNINPIMSSRIYEQIVQQILDMIIKGNLQPGERIPAERDLAELFHASRNSVRAAIRTLETLGFVVSNQGDGTYISQNSVDLIQNTLSFDHESKSDTIKEIITLRKIFEPGIAYLAAQYATPEDIRELEDILLRHEKKAAKNEPGIEEDEQFHLKIAKMSLNVIVLDLIYTINTVIRESRGLLLSYQNNTMRKGHREILNCLMVRDSEAASKAMFNHIEEVEKEFNKIFTK